MSIIHDGNRRELLNNPNVLSLSSKHITYTKEFKLLALQQYSQGEVAPRIWASNGFNLSDFKPDYFRKCVNRWKSQYSQGEFVHKKKGKSKDIFLNKDEEIGFLRAENAILKELRALGVEGEIKSTLLSPELYREIVSSHYPDSVNWRELAKVAFINGLQDPKRD